MKKYLLLFAVSFFLLPFVSNAQSVEPKLVYPDNLAIDSDLDGLTDIGETTRFKTDPKNPDSDADGWYDGTEVLAAGNPLDNTAPSATTTISTDTTTREVPWVWYLTRASGLIAFAFCMDRHFLGRRHPPPHPQQNTEARLFPSPRIIPRFSNSLFFPSSWRKLPV
jgi:hypothetical protein